MQQQLMHLCQLEYRSFFVLIEGYAAPSITRNAEDRHYWTTLAERWERCAENAERKRETTRARKTHRRPDPIKDKAA